MPFVIIIIRIIIRINALFGKGGRIEKKENCVDMMVSLVWLAL